MALELDLRNDKNKYWLVGMALESEQEPLYNITMRKVIKPYQIAYPNPIRVQRGTVVEMLKEESKEAWQGWVWCKAEDGQVGWIPKDHLEITDNITILSRDYDATEISAEASETVEVITEKNGWAWARKSNGTEGWIPIENLEVKENSV